MVPGSGSATPCPRGTYKSEPGLAAACTGCPLGVTTAAEGSSSLANCTSEFTALASSSCRAQVAVTTESSCYMAVVSRLDFCYRACQSLH
jgi:hypothetical protein